MAPAQQQQAACRLFFGHAQLVHDGAFAPPTCPDRGSARPRPFQVVTDPWYIFNRPELVHFDWPPRDDTRLLLLIIPNETASAKFRRRLILARECDSQKCRARERDAVSLHLGTPMPLLLKGHVIVRPSRTRPENRSQNRLQILLRTLRQTHLQRQCLSRQRRRSEAQTQSVHSGSRVSDLWAITSFRQFSDSDSLSLSRDGLRGNFGFLW